jgi:hypothetical protein
VHHNRFGRTSHTEKTGLPEPLAQQEENDGYYRFLIPLGRVEVDPNMRWSRRLAVRIFLEEGTLVALDRDKIAVSQFSFRATLS